MTSTVTAPPLPPHRIRFSRRARRVSLRVSPGKGLEVVLPINTDPSCVPQALLRHSRWIEKHLRRMPEAVASCPFPLSIALKGGCELVYVRELWERGELGKLRLPENPGQAEWRRLRQWTREKARSWLGPILEELAREHGFSFASMRLRFQRSRWGSCTNKGGISLNVCLIFLPEPLVRYILLHELCHTRQMNHSAAFWKLVFAADPDALTKDKAMRSAWKYVPSWIYAS